MVMFSGEMSQQMVLLRSRLGQLLFGFTRKQTGSSYNDGVVMESHNLDDKQDRTHLQKVLALGGKEKFSGVN